MDIETINSIFEAHPINKDQLERIRTIRKQAGALAREIYWLCPDCEEKDLAIRDLDTITIRAGLAITRHE